MTERWGQAPAEVTIVANDVGPEGGMERQLRELIGGLLSAGTRVTLISWTCSLPPDPGLRWVRVRGPSRPYSLGYPLFLLQASVLAALRGRGPLHSTGAIVLNRGAVCTVHFCHRAFSRLGGGSRASRPSPAYRLNAWLVRRLSLLAERWAFRPGRAGRLVAVSEGVARELREHFPRMRERVVVIPNGVDTDAFAPAPRPAERSPGPLRALFVGGDWERKGLRPAIAAVARVEGVALTVLGSGDEPAYRAEAARLGAGDRVRFAGTAADVAPWFRDADAFLLPSAYETFSLVTYEAAACGLPLLATRVNGVEDLLHDGENGWFIDRDPESIARRLRALRDDPGLRLRMGAAARRDSLRFSWSSAVERYLRLYAESPA